ncbi:MAG: hypothetical protein J6F30_04415 [Cellulosilyticum sp.]|nr:hypothetical protein [Cellulosilyticum sp.]
MVKKEKQIIENANETTVDLTLQEPETPTEVTPDAPAKPKTRKTKSTTTKKTTATSTKATKTTKAAKESKEVIKEVVKEVVKIVTPEVYLQVAGFEFSSASFADQAREAWVASGHDENEIKSLKVYIKPEDQAVYYVVNETETGKFDFKLDL